MRESFESIVEEVEVIRLKEYYKLEEEEKKGKYIFRQMYKEKSKEYSPEELNVCVCKKVVSPDENLVMCGECGIFYHFGCSEEGRLVCSYCSETLSM